MAVKSFFSRSFDFFLSKGSKERFEKIILWIAIIGYLAHLLLILLNNLGILKLKSELFESSIAAIYTPFSFILVYEVYLLIFYLQESTTVYIGKQYEIALLIIIRRIFKDLAEIDLVPQWFNNNKDLQFTMDVLLSLVLFFLIYLFYRINSSRMDASAGDRKGFPLQLARFIELKRRLSLVLTLVLAGLATYSLVEWIHGGLVASAGSFSKIYNINNIFFDDFFSALIIVDVLLLLISFFYSDKFHTIIRNSGFVISTTLIKISFHSEGIINNLLMLSAVLFGLVIVYIHSLYERNPGAKKQMR